MRGRECRESTWPLDMHAELPMLTHTSLLMEEEGGPAAGWEPLFVFFTQPTNDRGGCVAIGAGAEGWKRFS